MGECPCSPEISTRDLYQGWPPWRAGNRTAPDLVQRGVLDATLFPCAPPIPTGLKADTTTFVLGLVELAVDDVLEHDEKHAYEDGKDGDADVCLEVPFLQRGQDISGAAHGAALCVWGKIIRALALLHVNKHITCTCCETYISNKERAMHWITFNE